ncbi:MAG: hypothetical protein WC315_09450 [Candidatus Omnitrophota bacterium]|jgi:hypothetical protein
MVSEEMKALIDRGLEEGWLKPTIFVRENPDGSPCFELKTKIVCGIAIEKDDASSL